MPFYLWCYVHCFAVPKSWSHWLHPGGGMWLWQLASVSRFCQVKYINDHGHFVLFVRRRMILGILFSLKQSGNHEFPVELVDPVLPVWPHWCSTVGKIHLPWPAGSIPSNAGQEVIFCERAHCWLLFSLVSSRSLELFSADCFWKCC